MKHTQTKNNPIVHGRPDPTEIPYYCKMCAKFNRDSDGRAYCSRREDGKLIPEPCNTCFIHRSRKAKDDTGTGV